jgi:hypothetical protein
MRGRKRGGDDACFAWRGWIVMSLSSGAVTTEDAAFEDRIMESRVIRVDG